MTYAQRLATLHELFGYDFGKRNRKRGKLFFGHNQWEFEQTDKLVAELLSKPVARFVELGVNWGASLFMLARFLTENATIIGVDCGIFPGIHDVHRVLDHLGEEGHSVEFYNATTADALARVKLAVSNIDLLHIDAGHEYADAKHDWDHYTPLVATGGLILLHDIAYTTTPGVAQFWDQIKPTIPKYHEIIARANGKVIGNGMAVIVKTW